MTLPVSSYEELLVRVRSLTHETIQLRRELSSSLSAPPSSDSVGLPGYATHPQRSVDQRRMTSHDAALNNDLDGGTKVEEPRPVRPTTLFPKTKENETDVEQKDVDERRSSPEPGIENEPSQSEMGKERVALWHSGPSCIGFGQLSYQNTPSVVSFTSSLCSTSGSVQPVPRRTYSHQQLGAKVEMVYNLLSLLGTNDREDMSKTLLAMSSTAESCQAMRQSGCLPLLIQLIHANDLDQPVRTRASEALSNIVQAQNDEKRRRRESRVLKLLQSIREHCTLLKVEKEQITAEMHPHVAVAALMKFSFDAEHRQAMCTLGGLHAIAELIQLENETHGNKTEDMQCITMRRYCKMALTNLTFGDGANKALLCSFTNFMEALVAQLASPSEDLRQITASVIRNLSWRAEEPSKTALREVGAVTALMTAAMEAAKEGTLKSILSALWNLSAHCSMNKQDICQVPGALEFLVRMLRYKSVSNTLVIIESAGGIIKNISSHISADEDYRQIIRDAGCFEILLEQLKSPSLTIVSNACGTLWNLSARCAEDQRRLWDMGAASMLRSLIHSKHKMIAMGSSAALKNLINANPSGNMMAHVDSTARGLGLQNLPTLFARKQRALEQELDATLAETCENIEIEERARGNMPKRSDSKESVTSTKSDSVYERLARGNIGIDNKDATLHGSLSETSSSGRRSEDAKLLKRLRTSGIPMPLSRIQNETNPPTSSKPIPVKRGIPVLKTRFRPRDNPVQNSSFTTEAFPEEETTECPINYSLRDYEAEDQKTNKETLVPETAPASNPPSSVSPGLYAETDLDQPTDFSLKYGEETSSDEEIPRQNYGYYDSNKNDVEDTTRTYYTEGTPYEGTPYNFSSATSMSDLRIDPCETDGKAAADEKIKENSLASGSGVSTPGVKLPPQVQEASVGNTANTSIGTSPGTNSPAPEPLKTPPAVIQAKTRDFESGVSTPERPVYYCEEGTPGASISRVSSLSSISGKELTKATPEKKEKDAVKSVTFTVNDTPLMFSRSSSLASLNSLAPPLPDQDGASSVVSTFSHVESGIISPSELPDSPTQNEPDSPETEPEFSTFRDTCRRYTVEETPEIFSDSSLSSLSFDRANADDDRKKQARTSLTDRLELSSVSECDEDRDDDILADCISIGMQDTRNRPRIQTKPALKPRTCATSKPRTVYEDTIQTYRTEDTPANISHAGSHSDLSILTVPGHEDGSASSSDTENILNECIHSGMPQGRKSGKKSPNMGMGLGKRVAALKPPQQVTQKEGVVKGVQPTKDETQMFVTEDSPCTFSTRSSFSDLTIQSESGALHRIEVSVSPGLNQISRGASPSSINLIECEDEGKANDEDKRDEWSRPNTRDTSFASIGSSTGGDGPSVTEDLVTALSRSLSQESFDSCEPTPLEQALLEQCIHSGMPHRSKNGLAASAVRTAMGMDADGAAGASATVNQNANTENTMNTSCSLSDECHKQDTMAGSQTWSEENRKNDVMVTSIGNHTWSDEASFTASGVSSGSGEDVLRVVDGPVPLFKVGADVTSSALAIDASRICKEIQKLQEQEPQCIVNSLTSLTSEWSLASNDSFLDAELSGLELPDRPTPEFLASEEHPVTLKLLKLKNEPLSIPSLGPMHLQMDADLENSMVSVASITSEIAETHTLADIDGSDTEVPDDEEISVEVDNLPLDEPSPQKTRHRLTPKEKRKQTQERYRTYTVDELKAKCEKEEAVGAFIPNKLTPKQRRLNDRDRFLTRTISLEEEPAVPEIPPPERKFDTYRVKKNRPVKTEMTAAERLELVANATLVAQCLTTDDRSINTDTYVAKPPRTREIPVAENGTHLNDEEIREDESENEDGEESRGPRITVPEAKEDDEDVKAIRGRRKPLYSSPALQRATKSGPPSPKTIVPRVAVNGSPARSRLSHPPPLVREGTFTKEDGVKNSRLPEPKTSRPVGIPRPTTAPSPAVANRNGVVKTRTIASAPPTQKRHSTSGFNVNNSSQPANAGNSIKRHSVPTPATGMKNSASNQSIKSTGSAKSVKSPSSASPEKSRSSKPKTPKKEVTSKIASLWKKVEETKRRDKNLKVNGKDTRVWITNAASQPDDEILVIEQEEVLELNSGKIVRSSTFQGEAKPKTDSRVRSSGDFSNWDKNEGRISAVVAPFNYTPPPAKPVSNLKQTAPAPSYPNKVTTV